MHERTYAAAPPRRGRDIVYSADRRYAPRVGRAVSRPIATFACPGSVPARLCRPKQLLSRLPTLVRSLARTVQKPVAPSFDGASAHILAAFGSAKRMSALGQKQTYAAHKVMSASLPIATAIADSCKRSCLLYPRKRTCAAH